MIQEFVHVMASVTNYHGNPSDLMNDPNSGLLNYLFGKDRKNKFNRERMHQLQQELMDDVLWLEFTRYSKDGKTISEVDFCNHLLLCANITSKKKKKMVSILFYNWMCSNIFIIYIKFLAMLTQYSILNFFFSFWQIKRVKKGAHIGQGLSFEDFKCFYNVLFGGSDLERAMFFLDTEKNGINR